MKLTSTAIPDVVLIEPTVYEDGRGWFMESFNEQRFHAELQKLSLPVPRLLCRTTIPAPRKACCAAYISNAILMPKSKLVRVVNGAAFDVAVDIRPDSPTFGKWVGVELSAANKHMLDSRRLRLWLSRSGRRYRVPVQDDGLLHKRMRGSDSLG
ncbi:dTDP-4-dehydrorhamnose 3,5-epimerase [Stutzerimonas stutzeri ATCC 14405 = CCUG 16156]|nr:dTDP-4-dehydrorhamnose 3,5-epimerase [Stutzerimonas stutzeri ATCC 14405 = CCUG 16156]